MHTESTAFAPRPANSRSRATNRPQKMAIDGRTELGRRVRDLAESFAQQLGGWTALTDMQAAAVRRAAELGALAEQSRRDALRGGSIDPLALSRLEGVAARAERALGLPAVGGKPAATSAPTFAEIALQAQADAARRRAHELATDAEEAAPLEPTTGCSLAPRGDDRIEADDDRTIEVIPDDD
jgi:hypothetical protein